MSAPLRFARLGALALAFAFGIIGMSLGINALAKSRHQTHELERNPPLGASVSIDDSDVFASGVVGTVVCGLIALTSFVALFAVARPGTRYGARAHKAAAHVLLFLSVWLFATLVPFTDFVANRQAKISASLGGQPLPASLVQAFEQELGVTPVYHKINYLRNATILPWFAFLFALLSAVLLYLPARGTTGTSTTAPGAALNEKRDGGYAAGAFQA